MKWTRISRTVLITCLFVVLVAGQQDDDPCQSEYSIDLPGSKKCLNPQSGQQLSFAEASRNCEDKGGTLFEISNYGSIPSPRIETCLSGLRSNLSPQYNDFWIDAVGIWEPNWSWTRSISGSKKVVMNPATYCTSSTAPANSPEFDEASSDTLSVEYCISMCYRQGANYTVLHSKDDTNKCYCVADLPDEFRTQCNGGQNKFLFSDNSTYLIIEASDNPMYVEEDSEPPTSLCASVNSTMMVGESCFNKHPFICELPSGQCLVDVSCSVDSTQCTFLQGDVCLKRVNTPSTWHAAKGYCEEDGYDLWKVNMTAVADDVNLDPAQRYWTPATNYDWDFKDPVSLGSFSSFPVPPTASCGHMIHTGITWEWRPDDCLNAIKSYICQYDKTSGFVPGTENEDAVCSWMDDLPCSDPNAIIVPESDICAVVHVSAHNWLEAQRTCERGQGTLYRVPDARLESPAELMNCLASNTDSELRSLWLNALGFWFQHWFWIGGRVQGNVLNPVIYCPIEKPPMSTNARIINDYLSVDYCVSACHEKGDDYKFTVLHSKNVGGQPECYCISELDQNYKSDCASEYFSYRDQIHYFIVQINSTSLVDLASVDTFNANLPMCAAVSTDTLSAGKGLYSDTCSTNLPFICCLGEASICDSLTCDEKDEPNCHFKLSNKCMLRVNMFYKWHAARAYCLERGGDLWVWHDVQEMETVQEFLPTSSHHWIGASNYGWTFDANSKSIGPDNDRQTCGHMFREGQPPTVVPRWEWGETVCDQRKSYLCQYNLTAAEKASLQDSSVKCPWDVIVYPYSTAVPVVASTDRSVGDYDDDDDEFPWAAMIAGIVAGLMLLTCIGLLAGFLGRRKKERKVTETLAFVPYVADTSAIIGVDYDSHGGMRSNMSSVSEHGSQVGLVKGGGVGGFTNTAMNSYMMSSSYGENSAMFGAGGGAKSTEHMHAEGGAAGERKQMSEAQMNSSMDERAYASTYNAMSNKSKEYMTLQAQMSIQDDAELSRMGSLRNKPEVALVTDNVDMNFTVNHAVSHGHPDIDRSRSSLERTMEEITLPASEGGVAPQIPERVNEARVITHMSSP